MKTQSTIDAPAVVVGTCAHGLAIVRALARKGVETHALEKNEGLPGSRTRHATLHLVPDIEGPGLLDALLTLKQALGAGVAPVLFLTNDNMVAQIARDWPKLQGHYRLSWSGCRQAIAPLVLKSALQARCATVGLLYPRTRSLAHRSAVAALANDLVFPVIAKPARPLSAFKVRVLHSREELVALVERFADGLPLLIQEWIPGDESRLEFCALYLQEGRVLGRFNGRKLRSRPMGHTTIAEPFADDVVFDACRRFFDGLNVTGPVSLEMKRDDEGRYWVIEPTVGRTDFWLGCCIANGVNLPYIEYCSQTAKPIVTIAQRYRRVWFNMDRDPLGPFWYSGQVLKGAVRPRLPSFLYLALDDLGPYFAGLALSLRTHARRFAARLIRALKLSALHE